MHMKNWNVYEQLFPLNGGRVNGNVVFQANLAFRGKIRASSGEQAIDAAKERFRLKHPMVHELNDMGDELWRGH